MGFLVTDNNEKTIKKQRRQEWRRLTHIAKENEIMKSLKPKTLTFTFILVKFYHNVLKSQLVLHLAIVVPEVSVTKWRHA